VGEATNEKVTLFSDNINKRWTTVNVGYMGRYRCIYNVRVVGEDAGSRD